MEEDKLGILDLEAIHSAPLDFKTHLHYVSFMKKISEGLEIKLSFKIDSKSKFKKNCLEKKLRLVKIIRENLEEEYKKAMQELEFSKICSIWIPVKSYYLIFNQLLILCSIIDNDEENINRSHKGILANFGNLIEKRKIFFNKEEFNKIISCLEASQFKVEVGDNLREEVDDSVRFRELLKKLYSYKLEDYCREQKIKNFYSRKNKGKKEKFLRDYKLSLFELFYWYRIKANYRDLSFLDQEIYLIEVSDFYENYYELTINFYEALKKLINEISKKRFGEILIRA